MHNPVETQIDELLIKLTLQLPSNAMNLGRSYPGGGGELPYKKGGDARREISNEPLKGTNLGVA